VQLQAAKTYPPKWVNGSQADRHCGWSRTTRFRLRRVDPNFPKPAILPTGGELWNVDELDAYLAALRTPA
jgi:hypothetical protein